jgi:hypothetical protein
MDSGTLPGACKPGREAQLPARITPTNGDGSLTTSGIKTPRIGIFVLECLEQIEASAITEILVEETEDLLHETGALPATVAAIAGLPGGVTITSIRGKVIPGGTQTQFPEYSIESCTRISRWPTAAVRGGGGNKWLDESPLFVSQVHVFNEGIFGLKKIEKKSYDVELVERNWSGESHCLS